MPIFCPTPEQRAIYERTVILNPWIPKLPHPRQELFLQFDGLEGLYGGAARGGKSEALLMAALQYVDVPGYNALILRRTYKELAQQGGMIDRAGDWLAGTSAKKRDGGLEWRFPAGAVLKLASMDNEADKLKFRGAELQFVGFDETTTFSEAQYTYLFSRLTKKAGMAVPTRLRGGTNPGGPGHGWCKKRFIDETHLERLFVQAFVQDNPTVDYADYVRSTSAMDHFTRSQLLEGSWEEYSGGLFEPGWFQLVEAVPSDLYLIRWWDLAGTAAKPGRDPDWTVGALMGVHPETRVVYIIDIVRMRGTPRDVELRIKQTVELDGKNVLQWAEEEGGSSGKFVTAELTKILAGYYFQAQRSTGDKLHYARPLSSYSEAGNVKILKKPWNRTLLDEFQLFTGLDNDSNHDDQVDACSKCYAKLTEAYPPIYGTSAPEDSVFHNVPQGVFMENREDDDDDLSISEQIDKMRW